MTRLADIAPRLAQARDGWLAEVGRLRSELRHWRDRWQKTRWLVEHRDLQLLRAGITGDRRYVVARARKPDAARVQMAQVDRELRRVEAALRELGAA